MWLRQPALPPAALTEPERRALQPVWPGPLGLDSSPGARKSWALFSEGRKCSRHLRKGSRWGAGPGPPDPGSTGHSASVTVKRAEWLRACSPGTGPSAGQQGSGRGAESLRCGGSARPHRPQPRARRMRLKICLNGDAQNPLPAPPRTRGTTTLAQAPPCRGERPLYPRAFLPTDSSNVWAFAEIMC